MRMLRVPRNERATFRRQLKALVAAGELLQVRGNRYGLPEKMDLVVGRLTTNPGGFGFVVPDQPLDTAQGRRPTTNAQILILLLCSIRSQNQ